MFRGWEKERKNKLFQSKIRSDGYENADIGGKIKHGLRECGSCEKREKKKRRGK